MESVAESRLLKATVRIAADRLTARAVIGAMSDSTAHFYGISMKILQIRTVASILTSVCLSVVVACSDTTKQEAASEPPPGPAVEQSPSPTMPMNVNEQLAFAIADLARRLGVEEGAIGTAVVRQVTWRSGALGCPEPGMGYTQALVPGLLIILQVGEEGYGYHARQGRQPFYCPRERVEAPASTTTEDIA